MTKLQSYSAFPLCSAACPERASRVEWVSFVVKGFGGSDPAPEPGGRNRLARVRKPRVKGRKPTSPKGGVIIEPRPSGLGTESKRNFRSAEGRRAARSAEQYGKIGRRERAIPSAFKSRGCSLGSRRLPAADPADEEGPPKGGGGPGAMAH
jgi:hypothetical protein